MNAGLLVFLIMVVLSFLGLPIYLAVAVGTMCGLAQAGLPMEALIQKAFLGLNSPSLLSVPFFILAGNLMARGITQRLIEVANLILGRVRGGLGCVSILASAMFGAISGSAVATVAAIGGMTIPAMKDQGYEPNYTAALNSAASLLGPMIPPSISLIIYASITESSVQKLFKATLTPAIVCTLLFVLYALWYGRKHQLPKQPKKTAKEALKTVGNGIWSLLLPVAVLGSIFAGICTATEAAAVSCVLAVIIALFVYRTMTFRDLMDVLYDSAISIAACMIMVGFSKASSYVVLAAQLPQLFMSEILSLTTNKYVVLIIINILLLILGCLMDGNSIIVMMVPLMVNLVKGLGISLIQFGIIVCINIYIGCITPPVGVSLLVGTKIGQTEIGQTFKAILPFFLLAMIILLLVTYVPAVTLWAL